MVDTQATDHFRRILQSLWERAKKDQVRWQAVGVRSVRTSFMVQLPASAIRIDFFSPEAEPDYYVARLYNDKGNEVQTLAASESDKSDWELLSGLSREANRSVTGWDKALADAEAAINATEPIGRDDIPF